MSSLEANKPVSLSQAMEMEPQIKELIDTEGAGELLDLALRLEDLTRGIGMHAGGVLIALGALAVQLDGAELAAMNAAFPLGMAAGARYTDEGMKGVDA